METGAEKAGIVKSEDLAPFEVRIAGRAPARAADFYEDLPDAFVDAFNTNKIKAW